MGRHIYPPHFLRDEWHHTPAAFSHLIITLLEAELGSRPKRLEPPERLYRSLFRLHCGRVPVKHLRGGPSSYSLGVLPGHPLAHGMSGERSPEDMKRVLNRYTCSLK